MKVLLIDNFLYRRGGAEVVFLNTGDLLKENGHNVVYFSQKWDENIPCGDEIYFPQGISSKTTGLINKLKGVVKYFNNIEAAQRLEELIKTENPDIAHVHLFWGGISGAIFKVLKKYHIPIVHTVHDYRMVCPGYAFKNGKNEICEKCTKGHYLDCIFNRCSKGSLSMSVLMSLEMYYRNFFMDPIKNIDSFMFVSDFAYKKHIQYDSRFNDKYCVTMYNFQDGELLNHVDSKLDTYNGYYMYYGRLSFEKGIQTLIKAFCKLPKLKLKIVGTGPLEEELKQLCTAYRADNIEFLGYKTGRDLYDIIKNAKFVCVPSEWYENNPMTIIESYTLRTPVLGASIGGIVEIVEEARTGYRFQPFNVADLTKAIEKAESLSREDYIMMKDNAQSFAKINFSKDRYYMRLMELYTNTINIYNNKN